MNLAGARIEGRYASGEERLRAAFEKTLIDYGANPSRYEAELGEAKSDELLTTKIGHPFAAWYEHLVTCGRFTEARAAYERIVPVLGAGFLAKPRAKIRKLVETLASMADPEIFDRAFRPDFLPYIAAEAGCAVSELGVARFDRPLPYGGGHVEVICVSLPAPLCSSEPLWLVFARIAGTREVRVFTLEWFAEEMRARPAVWNGRTYLGPREYGSDLVVTAPPCPSLGVASPYLPLFLTYVGLKLEASAPRPPGAYVPASFPPSLLLAPVPSLAPRAWGAAASETPPPPSSTARDIALILLALLLVASGALGLYLRLGH